VLIFGRVGKLISRASSVWRLTVPFSFSGIIVSFRFHRVLHGMVSFCDGERCRDAGAANTDAFSSKIEFSAPHVVEMVSVRAAR